MIEIVAFVSFFALVAAWLAAPKDSLAESMGESIMVSSTLPVAEAKA